MLCSLDIKAGMTHSTSALNVWVAGKLCSLSLTQCMPELSALEIEHSTIYGLCLFVTRMWANAERDGRPAKYRWCPLFNAAKFG